MVRTPDAVLTSLPAMRLADEVDEWLGVDVSTAMQNVRYSGQMLILMDQKNFGIMR